jgi:hypothetical protein
MLVAPMMALALSAESTTARSSLTINDAGYGVASRFDGGRLCRAELSGAVVMVTTASTGKYRDAVHEARASISDGATTVVFSKTRAFLKISTNAGDVVVVTDRPAYDGKTVERFPLTDQEVSAMLDPAVLDFCMRKD